MTDWFQANKLSLNTTKTNYVLIHNVVQEVPPHNHKVYIAGTEIKEVDEAPFLGLIIDKNLQWQAHIGSVKSKLSKSLYILRQVCNILPKQILTTLYYSLVYSKLQYGIMHCGTKATFNYNLEHIIAKQDKAICIINKKKITKRNSHLFAAAKVLKFDDIVRFEMLKVMYEYYHKNLPLPLMEMFVSNEHFHPYNTRHAQDPHLKIYRYKIASESFLHRGPSEWSKLNQHIISAKTKYVFSKRLKRNIIANY